MPRAAWPVTRTWITTDLHWPAVSLQSMDVPWTGIFIGGFLAFYAFIGFEDIVNVAEEVKSAERTLPRAIIIALVGDFLFLPALLLLGSKKTSSKGVKP